MTSRRSAAPLRRGAAAAVLAVVALTAGLVRADEKAACVAASEQGQQLRDQGKLRDARDQFALCARDACPGAVRKDCLDWLAGVQASVPTIVLAAVDAEQHDLVAVRVSIDGKPAAASLDGKAMAVEVGPHTLLFEADGFAPVEVSVVAHEGEQRRLVSARFASKLAPAPPGLAAPLPPAPAPPRRAVPVAPIVLGGLGVVALGAWATLGILGKNELSNLRDTCGVTHTCAQADVDATRNKLLAADISLATGVVAVGVATGLLIAHLRAAPPMAGLRVEALPLAKGGGAALFGSF